MDEPLSKREQQALDLYIAMEEEPPYREDVRDDSGSFYLHGVRHKKGDSCPACTVYDCDVEDCPGYVHNEQIAGINDLPGENIIYTCDFGGEKHIWITNEAYRQTGNIV